MRRKYVEMMKVKKKLKIKLLELTKFLYVCSRFQGQNIREAFAFSAKKFWNLKSGKRPSIC